VPASKDLPRADGPTRSASSNGPTRTWVEAHSVPLAVSALGIVLGMAYSLFWAPVIRHTSVWITPSDFWATYRAAHYVGWGDLGGIYGAHANVVTFPGIVVALAPCAILTGHLGLFESYPIVVAHPSAWLVSGPLEMLIGSVALFGADALGARFGLSRRRRALVTLFVAVGLWNTDVLWGHPEDAIAVGLSCYALVAIADRRKVAAGWILGAAVAFQPLVLLLVPLAIASLGIRKSWSFIWRCAAPAAFLLVAPLVADYSDTVRALVEQPNYPNLDHRTPWTSLAPTLGGSGRLLIVAAGPVRLLSVVGACALAVILRRRLSDPRVLVWAASSVLLLRCATESVMVAYYLWPTTVFAGVLIVNRKPGRALVGLVVGSLLVVFADLRLAEWPWWLGTIGGLCTVVAVAAPPLKSVPLDDDHIEVIHSRSSGMAHSSREPQRGQLLVTRSGGAR
jgi:hypothetical protein